MSARSSRALALHLTMLAMLCIPTTSTFGQVNEPPDVFKPRMKVGSPEWYALSTAEERMESLQMPESVRKSISTEGLLESCLRFETIFLAGALNSSDSRQRDVVAHLERRFNGFIELPVSQGRRTHPTGALQATERGRLPGVERGGHPAVHQDAGPPGIAG